MKLKLIEHKEYSRECRDSVFDTKVKIFIGIIDIL